MNRFFVGGRATGPSFVLGEIDMVDQNLNPEKILRISGAYWQSCALHAAVKLNLFTIIGDQPTTAAKAAEKIGADPRSVEVLLNAMAALEFVEKRNGEFRNTKLSAKFLCRDSAEYVGFMVMHHHHLIDSWGKLDDVVMTGRPVRSRSSHGADQLREAFLMGMFNMAMALAPKLSKEIDLTGRRTLLDLGGGPGTWAVHFCLANPELRATVFDLPTSAPFAKKIVDRFKVGDRVDFQGGDFTSDPLPGGYDAAWLSHILHGENPEQCQEIVNKAAGAINPGGLVMIHEFILDNDGAGPVFPTLFSLNMLAGTDGGRAYTEQDLADMLTRAGAGAVERAPFSSPNGNGVMVGRL